MSVIILVASLLEGLPTVRLVQIAAVLSGQVPYGLFLMIVVAYALGALDDRQAGRAGAAGQRGRVAEQRRHPVHGQDRHADRQPAAVSTPCAPLGDVDEPTTSRPGSATFVRSASDQQYHQRGDRGGHCRASSSAASTKCRSRRRANGAPWRSTGAERRGVYVLGAIEMLAPYLPPDARGNGWPARAAGARHGRTQGLRVLLFAYNPDVTTLHDAAGPATTAAADPAGAGQPQR